MYQMKVTSVKDNNALHFTKSFLKSNTEVEKVSVAMMMPQSG